MSTEVFEEASKRLVKPQVGPPEAGDQVAEPLVSKLVSHDGGDKDLVVEVGVIRVVKQVGFSGKQELILES